MVHWGWDHHEGISGLIRRERNRAPFLHAFIWEGPCEDLVRWGPSTGQDRTGRELSAEYDLDGTLISDLESSSLEYLVTAAWEPRYLSNNFPKVAKILNWALKADRSLCQSISWGLDVRLYEAIVILSLAVHHYLNYYQAIVNTHTHTHRCIIKAHIYGVFTITSHYA